jgi:hypothetical protein
MASSPDTPAAGTGSISERTLITDVHSRIGEPEGITTGLWSSIVSEFDEPGDVPGSDSCSASIESDDEQKTGAQIGERESVSPRDWSGLLDSNGFSFRVSLALQLQRKHMQVM